MELEQSAVDLDWDDDIDESPPDDDFDTYAEFETECTSGSDPSDRAGFQPGNGLLSR